MPTYKVRLAEEPTRVMNILYDGARAWDELRAQGATSSDMNVLVDLGFVEGDGHGTWTLTSDGRAAMRPAPVSTRKD